MQMKNKMKNAPLKTSYSLSLTDNEPLKTDSEAAEFLGVSRSFLKQKRVDGTGPVFIKLSRAVRYRLSDLNHWIAENARQNTLQINGRG